jgi:HEPN domain-containing protein
MRKSPLEEGQRWLRQAAEDLRWTRMLYDQGAYHLACFLSQQVTEKALKAFLYTQGQELVIGHSVESLCRSAAEFEPGFTEKARTWNLLDTYYIPTRYPNGIPDGIPADVFTETAGRQAVDMATDAVSYVRGLIEN